MSHKHGIDPRAPLNPTAKIARSVEEEYIGGYPKNLTKSVITAVEYLAHTVAQECVLKNGQTALFWALLGEVSQHVKEVKP